jgi:GntR family transcriptional regulator
MSEHNVKDPQLQRPRLRMVRHPEVSEDLARAIATGRYPVGSLLPTEFELCHHYGASRHTIRVAVAELASLGLVSRRKKIGTRVEAVAPIRGYRQTLASIEDLMQFGAAHVRSVQDAGPVTAGRLLAEDLGCPIGKTWFRIRSLRYNDQNGGVPFGLTEVYVDPAHAEMGKLAEQSPDRLISSIIQEQTGQDIHRIRQDVGATLINGPLAALLEADAGSAALKIVRHYLDSAGAMFVGSISIHPASRFRVSFELKRDVAG